MIQRKPNNDDQLVHDATSNGNAGPELKKKPGSLCRLPGIFSPGVCNRHLQRRKKMQAKLQNGLAEINSTHELLENGKAPPPDIEVSNSLGSDTAGAMTVIDGRQGNSYGTV